MCGIVGGWLPRARPESLAVSLDVLAHRGPDGRGCAIDGATGVMLGHVRLAIIDLSSAGAQPMKSDDGRITLVLNGEIYNYRELRSELESKGICFHSQSDTEVLLRLYIEEGLAMLGRLNGIFAFALHDGRLGELILARDALGIKPLYFSDTENGFAFASEIKGILPLLSDIGPLDLAALQCYLCFLWCPGNGTPLANVRKLGPGELIRVREGRLVEWRRWYTLPSMLGRAKGRLQATETVVAVRAALRRAVHRQLVADVPVGAFLSGGLDSTAVVAFAREQIPDIRCFTIETEGGRDSGEVDDLPYARRAANHLGVKLDVVRVDASQMARDIEELVWHLDEPLADPAPLNVLYISRLAREQGIKVLLSGAGGDDLFSGYRRHLAVRYEYLWDWLPPSGRRAIVSATKFLDHRNGLSRRLARLFAGAEKSGDERLTSYFAWTQPEHLVRLYSEEMRSAVAGMRADQPMLDYLKQISPDRDSLDRMLALEQRFFLADHNLLYTDKMSMAASVEVRAPFLDVDLVQLAADIPGSAKQQGRIGKWVLKEAMKPYLPRDLIYRPKTGFGAPLRRWMRNELREMLGDVLSEESLRRRGLFDSSSVQRLISDNDAGTLDAAYTLFSLLCVEIWCRRFLDKSTSACELS
jgi:asparagine synthase (glutamine-hydrolysing)